MGSSYVYTSSTIVDIYRPELNVKWMELGNGEYYIYRVGRNSIEKLESFNV